jgi:hypothetical protein
MQSHSQLRADTAPQSLISSPLLRGLLLTKQGRAGALLLRTQRK